MLDNEGNITYTNQSEDKFFRIISLLKHLKKAQAITENEAAFLRKKIEEKEAGVLLLGKASRYYRGTMPDRKQQYDIDLHCAQRYSDNVLRDYQKTIVFETILMTGFVLLLLAGLFYSISRRNLADQKAKYEKRNNELQKQAMKEMEESNVKN